MTDDFLTRIPSLEDDALRAYLDDPRKYRREAVEAAIVELTRRGRLEPGAGEAVLAALEERDAPRPGFLLGPGGPRRKRIRAITFLIVSHGVSFAVLAWLRGRRAAPAFDLEPTDSKVYLRQMEMMAGKSNVVASQLRHAFNALWEPANLPWTILAITFLAAGTFWMVATRLGRR